MRRTKKLLIGLSMCMALVGGLSISQRVQAAEDDFIIADEVLSEDSISDAEIQDRATSASDFVIENGVLTKYTGDGGDVVIPDGITEIGEDAFYNCSELTSIIIPYGATKIGDCAFVDCINLCTVEIPDSVREIGWNVFSSCMRLTDIKIPSSVKSIGSDAFNGTAITSIVIPEGITEIQQWTFGNCIHLSDVTLPDTLKKISDFAFINCPELTSIYLPDSVEDLSENAFSSTTKLITSDGERLPGDDLQASPEDFVVKDKVLVCYNGRAGKIKIPDSVTSIGDDAFSKCSHLSSVIIPSGVKTIGESAFYECGNLTSVVIPGSVTDIGKFAFAKCKSLTSVEIPFGVKAIGALAFDSCSGLTDISIADSVTDIGVGAFSECKSLKNISLPDSLTVIDSNAFSDCGSLTNITLPATLKSIRGGAFSDCSSLINITLPATLKSIEVSTFAGCKSLSEITIPNGVTEIGEGAFYGCTALSSIRFPDTLTLIGWDAFKECDHLSDVILPDNFDMTEDMAHKAFPYHTNITSKSGEIFNRYHVISSHEEFVRLAGEFSKGNMRTMVVNYSALGIEPEEAESILMDHRQGVIMYNFSLADVMFPSERVTCMNIHVEEPYCVQLWWSQGRQARLRELAVEKQADKILNTILAKNMSQKEKVKAIADWLVDNVEYDYKAAESYSNNPSAYMAYGALKDKKAVCEGFSNGFNLLARKAGIPSILAVSSSKSDVKDHAWNVYRLNGKYYEIDTTFHMREGILYEGTSIHKEFEEQGYYKTFMDYVASVDFTIPITNTKPSVTPKPDKPKTPNKGTTLKSKNVTYKVTKKGSEVAYTKISGASTSVNIPNTVKIGGITYKVTSVSPNAFKGNKKLNKVTIGANITSIGKNAFNGCKNLKTITIKSTKLKSVGQNAFKGIRSTARIKVPSKQLKAYKKLLKGKGQGKKVKITK